MDVFFTINGRLPGLNDYTKACRTHRQVGAKMKRECQQKVVGVINEVLPDTSFKKIKLDIRWVEPNKRRDPDNISSFGTKVILDALVAAGIISDDGWDEIESINHTWSVDKQNPRVEVKIEGSKHGKNRN